MRFYEEHALRLALDAARGLGPLEGVTHLIVTTCTGFYAPGLDLQLVEHLGLGAGVERTIVGFMGCQAALPALKLAAHIVRSRPDARVLTVNLELCTIHLQETAEPREHPLVPDLRRRLRREPGERRAGGPADRRASAARAPGEPRPDQLAHPRQRLPDVAGRGRAGDDRARPAGGVRASARRPPPSEVGTWAVHPGGRTILDAVEDALGAGGEALGPSRRVLRAYGNMSSATVMFVLARCWPQLARGSAGCAVAFGPGLTRRGDDLPGRRAREPGRGRRRGRPRGGGAACRWRGPAGGRAARAGARAAPQGMRRVRERGGGAPPGGAGRGRHDGRAGAGAHRAGAALRRAGAGGGRLPFRAWGLSRLRARRLAAGRGRAGGGGGPARGSGAVDRGRRRWRAGRDRRRDARRRGGVAGDRQARAAGPAAPGRLDAGRAQDAPAAGAGAGAGAGPARRAGPVRRRLRRPAAGGGRARQPVPAGREGAVRPRRPRLAPGRGAVPPLARRLAGASACWGRPLAVAGVPFGYLTRTTASRGSAGWATRRR